MLQLFSPTLRKLIVLAFCGAVAASAAAQVEGERPRRDTVVLVQRDTVVVVRKDTVFFQQVDPERSERPERSSGRGGSGRGGNGRPERYRQDDAQRSAEAQERIEQIRAERIARREERRAAYEAWEAAQEPVRVAGVSRAYKMYPTQMLLLDFPTVGFAAEQTWDGTYSVEAQLGIVLPPFQANDFGGFEPGEARFGLRGFRAGLGGRIYFGQSYKRFPFYVGAEISYALTPVTIDLWVPSGDGSFERRIDAPVNGHSTNVGAFTGWELRSKEGLVVDLATGLLIGVKGISSDNEFVSDAIADTYWNLFNSNRTTYGGVILRIGVGVGKWTPRPSKERARKARARSKRRRR